MKTSDLAFAAFLKASGYRVLDAVEEIAGRVEFYFEGEGEQLRDNFFLGETMVEPRAYYYALKDLKGVARTIVGRSNNRREGGLPE